LELVGFVSRAIVAKLIEQPFAALGGYLLDEKLGGEAFDVTENRGKVGSGEDSVEMSIENDSCIDFQSLVFTTVRER
jgi:hypothetical protein